MHRFILIFVMIAFVESDVFHIPFDFIMRLNSELKKIVTWPIADDKPFLYEKRTFGGVLENLIYREDTVFIRIVIGHCDDALQKIRKKNSELFMIQMTR